jgi:hypothetical protein
MLRLTLMLSVITVPLAACSFGAPPPSAGAQADLAACTQQAQQVDHARNFAYLSRTDQFATPFSGAPDQQYITNKLAEQHDQIDRINDCVRNSNQAYVGSGGALPAPVIVGPAQ